MHDNKLNFHSGLHHSLLNFIKKTLPVICAPEISFMGYPMDSIKRRLQQTMAEEMHPKYAKKFLPHFDRNQDFNDQIDCSCFEISPSKLRINWWLFLKILADALIRYLAVYLLGLKSLLTPSKKTHSKIKICRFYGLEGLLEKDKLQNFIDFMNQGNVTILHNDFMILGMNYPDTQINKRILITKRPIIKALKFHKGSLGNVILFSKLHLFALLSFSTSLLQNPTTILLSKDLIYHPTMLFLDTIGMISDLIYTNSDYAQQILPCEDLPGRSFKTHMIFYSNNTITLKLKHCKKHSELPSYYFMKVDKAWTWTLSHAIWLKETCQVEEVATIGPILIGENKLIPTRPHKVSPTSSINILCFDVTPMNMKWFNKHLQVRPDYTYYNSNICKKFISDIMELGKLNPRINLQLKPKRAYGPLHDQEYIKYIQSLKAENKISLIPVDMDMNELISNANIVISIPFTSTSIVAKHIGIPSVIYDPSEQLAYSEFDNEGITFIQTKQQLIAHIQQTLGINERT